MGQCVLVSLGHRHTGSFSTGLSPDLSPYLIYCQREDFQHFCGFRGHSFVSCIFTMANQADAIYVFEC